MLDDVDVMQAKDRELSGIRNKKIGFVFQTYNLISRTTALKNVELPMLYSGMSMRERSKRARDLLAMVEMEDRMKRAVDSYGDDPASIKNTINSIDKARANYYNYHTGYKWGDFTNYNLMINSSYITEDEAAELIKDYVEKRKYIEEE